MESTASGTRVYIGDNTACASIAEYEAQSWVEVGEVESLGEYGDTAAEVVFEKLADSRVKKLKGMFNAGTLPIAAADDTNDVGQICMRAALSSTFDFNFKVECDDAATVGGTGSVEYFAGKVFGAPRNVGGGNNVIRRNFTVGINTAILTDPAT